MRTLSPYVVLTALVGAIGAVVVAGCPQAECEHLTDCPLGEVCVAGGTCEVDNRPPPPPYDAGPPGDGGPGFDAGPDNDGGPNENLREPLIEYLNAAVTAIRQDPGDPGVATVATWSTGGLDEIGDLEIATNRMSSSPRLDFNNIAGGCDVDEVHWFADAAPLQLPQGDEYWYSCEVGGGAVLHYTDLAFAQSYRDAALDQIDLAAFVDSAGDTNGDARVVFAERGGSELKIVRFEPTDQESAPRGMEAFIGDVQFDAIAGIWTLVEGDNQLGDMVLVFDRGAGGSLPRLVPVQRHWADLSWHGPPFMGTTDLDIITLPEGTHGALFREDPGIPDPHQLTTGAADQDIPNVLITLPTEVAGGAALFLRYERENGRDLNTLSPVSGFPQISLGGANMPSTLPAASDKLLLRETDFDGPAFAYVLPTVAVGFSIPLPSDQSDDVTNDVKRGAFDNYMDVPSAFLPVSAGRMLIGFSNRNEIHQVGFSADF
ncbi:MAG: hypothetical protein A2138_04020 [Deltaproteobacteria bacterium RBG_16_71_12]|nr:MAG: hypothetical protein A2138_04020 [Deltaproteobacteria bacterium RBG_16_71_12]